MKDQKDDTRHPDQQETACGCEVWSTHNGHVYIEQCPLHANAQNLMESVEVLIRSKTFGDITGIPNARQILAQATGETPHGPR